MIDEETLLFLTLDELKIICKEHKEPEMICIGVILYTKEARELNIKIVSIDDLNF